MIFDEATEVYTFLDRNTAEIIDRDPDLIRCADSHIDEITARRILKSVGSDGNIFVLDDSDPRIQKLLPLVTLRENPGFDAAAHLSQANVTVRLKDGRTVAERADGARGYPGRLTDDELNTKFVACAQRSLAPAAAARVLDALRAIEATPNIAELTQLCLLVDR